MESSHTSVNLTEQVKHTTDEFHLTDKVLAVVTDNASNMKSAITNELQWKNFVCFAHTLNLIVQDALGLLDKIKHVVGFFKRSTTGMDKLVAGQKITGLNTKKLIHEIVKTTVAPINIPVLTEEEWTICKQLCLVQKPFEEVTVKISSK
ncbi:hypothetical protein PR048_015612 [Dryococelus australis]|uniref:Transposase n=1 Tax=Dryococelus australis TaxID=614101 RepID=A0ABQ9HHF9_9NEOP|nr:hypothetical protein PR048_015612 [Dryococelus australis]